jgi:hypothetical protein
MGFMGKKIALITGLAALVVIAIGIFCWREIAVQYTLARFRSEPRRFIEAVDQAEGSVQAAAVQKLVATGKWPAKDALQYYIAELARIDSRFKNEFPSDHDEVMFFVNDFGTLNYRGLIYTPGWNIKGGYWSVPLIAPACVLRKLLAIQGLLVEAHFKTADLPDYPGAEFTFFQKGEATDKPIEHYDRQLALKEACCFVQWSERIRMMEDEYRKRLLNDFMQRQLIVPQTK